MNHSINIQQLISRSPLCLLGLLGITLFASPVAAQVFDSGPSDSALFDLVINLPQDPNANLGQSIGGFGTTQLNVSDGGSIDNPLTVLSGGELNISGGTIADDLDATSGTEVNISGGTFEDRFTARAGSVVNVSGSNVRICRAEAGSELNISGGGLSWNFGAIDGSVVNISGGAIGPSFLAQSGSDVELIGGEFQLNGAPFSGDTFSISTGDVFTGTLADGSPFIFANYVLRDPTDSFDRSDRLSGVKLTSVMLPALDLSPTVVSTANTNLPSGLRTGQTLTLLDGGELGDDFKIVGATLNVEGGTLGRDVNATSDSVVKISSGSVGGFFKTFGMANISGGSVGTSFQANSGSVVNISGGSVGGAFQAQPGSEVNISGGTVGSFETADGLVNISGGTLDSYFYVWRGSVVNISGGTFNGDVGVLSGSVVNLFGSDFFLNGVPLANVLTIGEAHAIEQRDGITLTGLFADGSPFSFDLAESRNGDFFSSDATLTVTLVAPVLLGDCNLDGAVNFLDISPFIVLLATGFLDEADCNRDSVVNFLDISPFIGFLSNS